eukprot:SAG31_NODE_517_length_14689_cov_5.110487_3_plen_556_part_00
MAPAPTWPGVPLKPRRTMLEAIVRALGCGTAILQPEMQTETIFPERAAAPNVATLPMPQCGCCTVKQVQKYQSGNLDESEAVGTSPAVYAYLAALRKKIQNQLAPRKIDLAKTQCAVCNKEFTCRGALFQHLKKNGHAALGVRPHHGIRFESARDEAAVLSLLGWLLETIEPKGLPTELMLKKAPSIADLTDEMLCSFLDSGESICTVLIARMQTTPRGGPSEALILKLTERIVTTCPEIVWLTATDFESFSIPTKSAGVGTRLPGDFSFAGSVSNTQPVHRPRSMWGSTVKDAHLDAAELGPMALARRTRSPMLLRMLLQPTGISLAEQCLVCGDNLFMCCGAHGAVVRVGGCGCIACEESMRSWIDTQVLGDQKGTGEVTCVGCTKLLSQAEIDRFHPQTGTRAEALMLEKTLAKMDDWMWCPSGCGAGGFSTGCGRSKGCHAFCCPECDASFCCDCGLPEKYHVKNSGVWRSCSEALLQREQCEATEAYLRSGKVKACPKGSGGCGSLTERDGGCSHITCRVCKFEWCWLCEGKYRGKYTFGSKCPCKGGVQ